MFTGLVLMTAGQLWFAVAGTFPVGLAARVLLGAGDAMVFTSLLRLVAAWFRVKQAPFVTQLSGMVGQLGAVVAATPLAAALATWGWTRSFATAAGVGAVLGIALLVVVRDTPYRGEAVERIKLRALRRTLGEVWGNPGTRLGLWVHFTSQFGATVFTMLWGYPFLLSEGLRPRTASLLLVVMTFTAMAAGPVVAAVTARAPFRRSQLVLVVVTATGGPGSMVGFDLARTFHPSHRLGRATGVVNIGGFLASLLTIALIGVVLDQLAPGGPEDYTLRDFRLAMSVQFIFWAFGAVQLMRYRRKGLAHIDAAHPEALGALRGGETLLPGISRGPDASREQDG